MKQLMQLLSSRQPELLWLLMIVLEQIDFGVKPIRLSDRQFLCSKHLAYRLRSFEGSLAVTFAFRGML